jgi:hypothetical protein
MYTICMSKKFQIYGSGSCIMAWWLPESVETSSHVNKIIYELVVIVNIYRYCVCYTNGDVSYKV